MLRIHGITNAHFHGHAHFLNAELVIFEFSLTKEVITAGIPAGHHLFTDLQTWCLFVFAFHHIFAINLSQLPIMVLKILSGNLHGITIACTSGHQYRKGDCGK
ncbi:Uncharacterised protein [Vibrio cholerae]|nr:Uncharacterised protein [Vibrio cholerae]CSE01969.1 Uncharacterised protein [Vibrio cholerae]